MLKLLPTPFPEFSCDVQKIGTDTCAASADSSFGPWQRFLKNSGRMRVYLKFISEEAFSAPKASKANIRLVIGMAFDWECGARKVSPPSSDF